MSREIVVSNKLGLHARAAAKLVQLTGRFRCQVRLTKDGQTVDGKSILGILLLAATKGSTLLIESDGADEAEAMTAIVSLIENKFDEGE